MKPMAAVDPPFVPEDSAVVYCVSAPKHKHTFHAPVSPRSDAEAVWPFRDGDGGTTMTMSALASEHFEGVEAHAVILENRAKWVHFMVMSCKDLCAKFMCAVAVMAWYLIDDDASLTRLIDTAPDIDFRGIHFAVWTVLAEFRNSHALRHHLSDEAKQKYLDCYTEVVDNLGAYGVTLILDFN
jgi:hypothetical protein